MIQLLVAGILLLTIYQVVQWLRNAAPAQIARTARYASMAGIGIGCAALAGLALTRFPGFLPGLLFFAAPVLYQMFRKSRLGDRTFGSATAGPRTSEVTAAFLVVTLDHDSGEMQGRVLQGRCAGRRLGDLLEPDLLELLRECAADADSVRLLEAYLDRRLGPEWRRAGARAGSGGSAGGARGGTRDTDMSLDEAWEVLGLKPGSAADEIRAAHRRLMRTVHPDHGGSDYLAARVNRAKDLLLGG